MSGEIGNARTILVALALCVAWARAQAAEPAKDDGKRSRLPAAVAKAVDANCPGAEIDKLDVEDEGGIKVYDIEFKAGRGEMDVTEDGTVLDVATIVELKEVPEAAAAVIRKAAEKSAIRQLEKSKIHARIEKTKRKNKLHALAAPEFEYEAELAKGGEIEVAADGQIIKAPKSISKESPSPK